MSHFEDEFFGAGGVKLFAQGWQTDTPRAVGALVHGQGEHSGRYAHVGAAFNAAGYNLAAFDLRGHGRSEGKRGHSPSYESLMDDLSRFLEYVANRYPGVPLILYGHSMGGNLALNYCLRRQPELPGAIVTSPWLKLAFEPPAAQVALARIIGSVYPSFTQSSGLDNSGLSRDPKVGEAYSNDPLVHSSITARHFFNIHTSGLWALEHAAELKLPLLLMQGSADRVTSEPASRQFAVRAGSLVTYRGWTGCYHELHNEPEKKEVLRVMTDWIANRLHEV